MAVLLGLVAIGAGVGSFGVAIGFGATTGFGVGGVSGLGITGVGVTGFGGGTTTFAAGCSV